MIKIENLGCNIFVDNSIDRYNEWDLLPKEGMKFYPVSCELDGGRYYLQEKRENYLPFFTLMRVRNLFLAILSTILSLGFALLHPAVRQWFTGRQVVRIYYSSEQVNQQALECFRECLGNENGDEYDGRLDYDARIRLSAFFNENRESLNVGEKALVNQYVTAFARLAPEEVTLRNELVDLLLSDLWFQMHEIDRLQVFGLQPVIQAEEDVHSRDLVSKRAIEILRGRQGDLSPDLQEFLVQQCILFLESFPNAKIRKKALDALLESHSVRGFPAFLSEQFFRLPYFAQGPKIQCNGPEILARLWAFTQIYVDLANPLGQRLAEEGIATGLASAIENGSRVCQPGKTGRLVTAVLQGRLRGITSDAVELSPDAARDQFFTDLDRIAENGETKGEMRRNLFSEIVENKDNAQERERLIALLMKDVKAWLTENPVNNSEEVTRIIKELIEAELAI